MLGSPASHPNSLAIPHKDLVPVNFSLISMKRNKYAQHNHTTKRNSGAVPTQAKLIQGPMQFENNTNNFR